MNRQVVLLYGVVCYAIFFGTFLYAIGFVGDLVVPRTIDSGGVESSTTTALIVNLVLLGIFAIPHSVMARPAFKKWWAKIVPEPMERSTYVLVSSIGLILMFIFWRPMTGEIWNVEAPVGAAVLQGLFFAGWLIVLGSTFVIDHFDLFGLRQSVLYWRGVEYSGKQFMTPGPYKFIRHPLYLGWLTAFWATPTMTTGHLLFSVGTTGYIFIAVVFEEKDLMDIFGDTYKDYRARTPMIIPGLKFGKGPKDAGKEV